MKIIGGIGKFLLGGLTGGLLFGGKKQVTAQPITATRDDAAAAIARDDALRRRQGTAADQILNGSTGAEAAIGSKLVLGS